MAVSIDWGTRVIFVPRNDLTLIQSTPTEIRELDLNQFRLELKELEGTLQGIPFPDTHSHNQPVDVGGLTLARVVEIINGYTVTFENGAYAVNLVGANSNVGDVVNVNNVSVRSFNSAGLISNDAIEYASFNGGVTVDVTSGITGTVFPKGTPRSPVDNIPDAVLIAQRRGFNRIYIIGNITLDTGDILDTYQIVGQDQLHTEITMNPGASLVGSIIREARVSGTLDGGNILERCRIRDITYINGYVYQCLFEGGVFELQGGTDANILDSWSQSASDVPIFDMGVSGQSLTINGFKGPLAVRNFNDPNEEVEINMEVGSVILENTLTAGDIAVRGIASLIDNSNGANIDTEALVNKTTISNTVLNQSLAGFDEPNSVAVSLKSSSHNGYVYVDSINGSSGTLYPIGLSTNPVDNIDDAKLIAEQRGITNILFDNDYVFQAADDISGYDIFGRGHGTVKLTIPSGTNTTSCNFSQVELAGEVHYPGEFFKCLINGLNISSDSGSFAEDVNFTNCYLGIDGLTMDSDFAGEIHIFDSYSDVAGVGTPFVDFNNAPANLYSRNYGGGIELRNVTQGNLLSWDLVAGQIKVPASNTNGVLRSAGPGRLVDDSGPGFTVFDEALLNEAKLSEAVWDVDLSQFTSSSASAGSTLVSQRYGKIVYLDTVAGTPGTTFPIGTINQPVDNITDALAIASTNDIIEIRLEDTTAISGIDISGYTLSGASATNILSLGPGCTTNNCTFNNLTVAGTANGIARYERCVISTLGGFSGIAQECLIVGAVTVTGTQFNIFNVCETYLTSASTYIPIDINGSDFVMSNSVGYFEIVNKTGTNRNFIGVTSGVVKVANSCIGGSIEITGTGGLVDENGGTVVIDDNLMNPGNVSAIGGQTWTTSEKRQIRDALGVDGAKQDAAAGQLQKILGLTNHNVKITGQVYDAEGRITSSIVTIYPTAADADASTNPITSYTMNSTFNGNEVTEFKMTED